MAFRSMVARTDNQFPRHNVSGLKGYVFGRHWHEKAGPKIPTDHQDWTDYVVIRWPRENERIFTKDPVVSAWGGAWSMLDTDLAGVERSSKFPLLERCRKLCTEAVSKKPVILEWGCGEGNAARDLTTDQQVKGKALVFAYANLWFQAWNKIEGVKFLFFVKEQLPEYFRRKKLEVDLVFTHGAMETCLRGEDLLEHLRALASIMATGGIIVFPSNYARPELLALNDVFQFEPYAGRNPHGHYLMTKK